MLVLGAIALIPGLEGSVASLPLLEINTSYGLFLGLFPMNVINKVALIVMGVWGIWAAMSTGRSLPRSIFFSRAAFVISAVLAVLGLIPQTNTLFGYWPLFGNNVLSSAVIAVVGAYFGFALTSKVPADRTGPHLTRESLVR